MRILTLCRAGLVRSVALNDVLSLHFYQKDTTTPVDAVSVGHFFNSKPTLNMLFDWSDHIVIMQDQYMKHIPEQYQEKTHVCEVGPDTYGSSHHPELIDKVWNWSRENQAVLNIEEHQDSI